MTQYGNAVLSNQAKAIKPERKKSKMKTSEILSDLNMSIGTAKKSDVREAYRLADEGGIIQAGDMVGLMGYSDPTKHTTCELKRALRWLGCEDASE